MENLITLDMDGEKKEFLEDTINYVRGCGSCSEIVFFDGEKQLVANCLSELEQQLDLKTFIRISEDCFVNTSRSLVAIESELLGTKEETDTESECQPQHFICLN